MKELLLQLINEGLSPEQAARSIETVAEWMEDTYPIAGALMQVWIRESLVSERDTTS